MEAFTVCDRGCVTVLDRGCDLTQVRWRLEMLTAWGACTNQLALPLLSVRCNAKVVASVVSSSQAAKAPTLSPTLDPPSSTYVQPKGPVRSPQYWPLGFQPVHLRGGPFVDVLSGNVTLPLYCRYIAVTLPLQARGSEGSCLSGGVLLSHPEDNDAAAARLSSVSAFLFTIYLVAVLYILHDAGGEAG